jgi:transitional endoplasmic reticulum ATPase
LEKLGPGLSKRPSRFDRKYGLPLPSNEERMMYCEFWRQKLKGNKRAVFLKELCPKIAKIMEGLSFAYMKEAFVATLLAVAKREDDDGLDDESEEVGEHFKNKNGDDIEDLIIWKEMERQIRIMREDIDGTSSEEQNKEDTFGAKAFNSNVEGCIEPFQASFA